MGGFVIIGELKDEMQAKVEEDQAAKKAMQEALDKAKAMGDSRGPKLGAKEDRGMPPGAHFGAPESRPGASGRRWPA